VHLAKYAGRVTILVRGSSLAATMSDYLIKEIGRADNLEVRYNTEVVDGDGQAKLDRLVLRDTRSGTRRTVPAFALFVLIGAHPNTDWLPTEIHLDEKGFVLTGADVSPRSPLPETFRPPYLLETSISGVFAAGDIRHGSEKRVAAAVGEGSTAIRLIHQHLNKLEELAVRK
jgi:thioredoxin reductase (NADPH)